MTDLYAYWRHCAEGKDVASAPVLPTMYGGTPECPQPGIYKTRQGKGGPMVPVQIWLVDAEDKPAKEWAEGLTVTGTINGNRVTADAIADRWIWLTAVTKDEWAHYKANGQWPGEITIGHNSGDVTLSDEIDEAYTQAIGWLNREGIKDKLTADMAANYRSMLLGLSKKADTERESKVRPHLDAQREINAEYKPLIERATEAANLIRDALTKWMRAEEAKARAAAEAARKAEAERVAKEREKIELERAEKMAADPIAALTEPEPDMPMPVAIEAPKVSAGGQRGKKAGLRTQVTFTVTDYEATLAFVKDHEAVREAVTKAAIAIAKTGVVVPGLTRTEERVAA